MHLNSPVIEKNHVITEPFGIVMYIMNNGISLQGKIAGNLTDSFSKYLVSK